MFTLRQSAVITRHFYRPALLYLSLLLTGARMHNMVFLDAASMGDADLTVLSTNIPLTCYEHSTAEQVVPRLAQASIAIGAMPTPPYRSM